MNSGFLLYGSSISDVNILYFGNFFAPDAFWVIKSDLDTIAIVSDLEYSRCLKEGNFSVVFTYDEIFAPAKEFDDQLFASDKIGCAIKFIAKKFNINKFIVPQNFPVFMYKRLENVVNLSIDDNVLTNIRAIKTENEICAIKHSCDITRSALSVAEKVIENSDASSNNVLYYDNEVLTAERLRYFIEVECLKHGFIAEQTIVSCAKQAADPHCIGTGPLLANELIVVDVFPRNVKSGFFGDMTRTFFKGKLSKEQQSILSCVKECQLATIQQVKPGVTAASINNFATKFFESSGFPLMKNKKFKEGFIHSIGHGIGLSLHEAPSMASEHTIIQENMVFTIEPGLYYQALGGARTEDVVRVTNTCAVVI